MLVDSHCHLDRLQLDKYENGLADAVRAAHDRGVEKMLCVCISEKNKDQVIAIADQFEGIYASVGVHPCDVSDVVETAENLVSWARHPKVIAMGETGLDYYHSTDAVDAQQRSFIAHLEAAKRVALPVIVHTRNARQDTIDLIHEYGCLNNAGVLHCFTESWEMAKQALDLNYYISLSGIVTFKNAIELKDVAKNVPLDRLLVETDSPYLAPVPYRGKPNEPKYVREVAEYIAELRGMSFEALAQATTHNFHALFKGANNE